jgi:hypothetical protein
LKPPPVSVFLAENSDPLQVGIEEEHRVTERILTALASQADRISTVTLRTRNPGQLLAEESEYLQACKRLGKVVVQVTVPLLHDEKRAVWEPGAPPAKARLEAVAELRKHGIPAALRLAPLLPVEPLSPAWFRAAAYKDLGCPAPGPSLDELEALLAAAADAGCSSVSLAPLALPCGRGSRSPQRKALAPLFRRSDGRFAQRGGAFHLPQTYVLERLVPPVTERAERLGLSIAVEPVEY